MNTTSSDFFNQIPNFETPGDFEKNNGCQPPAASTTMCKMRNEQPLAAAQYANANPATLKEVHRLIDHGWEHSLSEGLLEESRASGNANRGIEATVLEETRKEVQNRGRDQVD